MVLALPRVISNKPSIAMPEVITSIDICLVICLVCSVIMSFTK